MNDQPRSAVPVRQARSGPDDTAVAQLMTEYLVWALAQLESEYGIVDMPVDPTRAATSLEAYQPPRGLLAVAELDDQIVGVGAARSLGPGVAELKRMYVLPRYRGRHVASAVLDFLLQQAHDELQAETVRLDTCRFMTSAQRIYRSRQFVEREPYEGTEIPARLQQHWLFFERDLRR